MANHLDLEEQEQIEQLKHFWNSWGTLITAILVVVFAALAGWNGWQYWQKRQAVQASALEYAVDEALTAKDAARAGAAFAELKEKFAGTTQAAQTALLMAKASVDAGKLEAARALKPIDERALAFGKTVMLFDGVPQPQLRELGETRIPGLADLFVATMKGTYA